MLFMDVGCKSVLTTHGNSGRNAIMQSVFCRLRPEQIIYEPFPHVWVRDALDPAYYEELANAFPTLEHVAGSGPLANNQVFRTPACDVLNDPATPVIWRDFFSYHCSAAFLRELTAFWRTAIEREYPDIERRFGKPLSDLTCGLRRYRGGKPPETIRENMRTDVRLDTQFVVNSPVTEVSTVRGPHLDKPYKLFAGILYMRHPDDRSTGGTLELYRLRDGARPHFDRRQHVSESFVAPFDEVPYAPNTLVLWLNTPRALHGVSPRSTTDVPRRYINFIAECYRLQTDTFFSLERNLLATAYVATKRAVRRRMIREVAKRGNPRDHGRAAPEPSV
jgi:hypothetical protein